MKVKCYILFHSFDVNVKDHVSQLWDTRRYVYYFVTHNVEYVLRKCDDFKMKDVR